jgi:hypothetical protein
MDTGYNMAAWADQGYKDALAIFEFTLPTATEAIHEYGMRIYKMLLKKKAAYYDDAKDEGGGATGALQDAILALIDISKNEFNTDLENKD